MDFHAEQEKRGALEAGAIGNLLPGGRPVTDAAARVDLASAWSVAAVPTTVGRSTKEIVSAVNSGELNALVVGGVDPLDLDNSTETLSALKKAFVVSLEIAPSAITERADVVLPVAAVTEKSGSFLNWTGSARAFDAAVADSLNRSDVRILSMIADALGKNNCTWHCICSCSRNRFAGSMGWCTCIIYSNTSTQCSNACNR
jgi:NADH-quinone oxidoreductase subunit G